MKVYNYHPVHKYFTGEEDAIQSPEDPPGTWLIPAHSTKVVPPETKESQVAYWNEKQWEVKDLPEPKTVKICPLLRVPCIGLSCAWFTGVLDPDDNPPDPSQCLVVTLPLVLNKVK